MANGAFVANNEEKNTLAAPSRTCPKISTSEADNNNNIVCVIVTHGYTTLNNKERTGAFAYIARLCH